MKIVKMLFLASALALMTVSVTSCEEEVIVKTDGQSQPQNSDPDN